MLDEPSSEWTSRCYGRIVKSVEKDICSVRSALIPVSVKTAAEEHCKIDLAAPMPSSGTSITKHQAPKRCSLNRGQKTSGELFELLDTHVKPSITAAQFKALFTECECGMVTTRCAFVMHECILDLCTDVSSEN